mgnify:CR=1 FL=1
MAGDWRLEEDMQFVMHDGVVDCDIGGDCMAMTKLGMPLVVMEKFDGAEDRCRADAEMLLRQMVEAKIVTQTAGG